jgi:hypothetical protein
MTTTFLKAGTVKRLHVNRQVVARNRKLGEDRPTLTVQTSKGPIPGRRVRVFGSIVFDQGAKQLSCGARIYGVTHAAMEVTT